MKNENLLFEENKISSRNKIMLSPRKEYIYKSKSLEIDLKEIKSILTFIRTLKDQKKLSRIVPIVIDLGKGQFVDKLPYILMQCICHMLIKQGYRVKPIFNCFHTIFNEGIKSSYIQVLDGSPRNDQIFCDKFTFEINGTHYRRVIRREEKKEQLCRYSQEIESFLKFCGIDSECCGLTSDVVVELVDNALDHSNSDCLVDIDITNPYIKDNNASKRYCGVNIVILSFSNVLMGFGLKEKLDRAERNIEESTDRYNDALIARSYHSNHWNADYTEEDFHILVSFQHRISCRDSFSTGGTGLTQLINALEDKADSYNCYMLTGERIVHFNKEFIHEEHGWIGFNIQHDFLGNIPDTSVIGKSGIVFPGTSYNLNFAMEMGEQ